MTSLSDLILRALSAQPDDSFGDCDTIGNHALVDLSGLHITDVAMDLAEHIYGERNEGYGIDIADTLLDWFPNESGTFSDCALYVFTDSYGFVWLEDFGTVGDVRIRFDSMYRALVDDDHDNG